MPTIRYLHETTLYGPRLARCPRKPVSEHLDILYAAHTASCTFLLDAEGICRRIVPVLPTASARTGKRRDTVRAASRCVGAQYVASLDANVAGMLAEMPRVGAPMLFARMDERGRISLVRTGNVTRFESHRHDPFTQGADRESLGLLTSAPAIAPSAPAPRRVRESERVHAQPEEEVYEDVDLSEVEPVVPPARDSELRTRDSDVLNKTAEYETPRAHGWPDATPAPRAQTMMPPAPTHADDDDFQVKTIARAPRRELVPPPVPAPRLARSR